MPEHAGHPESPVASGLVDGVEDGDEFKAEQEARYSLGTATKSPWAKYFIDPRTSRFVAVWDGITSLALFFVTIVTPIEVGFLEPAGSWLDPLFLVNQAVNLVFVIDCILQFFLMVQITDKNGTRYVSDPGLIASQYLRTWFPIDILSIAVAAVDYVGISSQSSGEEEGGSATSDVDSLRSLRVLRALRLIKLSKLISGQKIIKRYETRVAINYAAISLLRCLLGMMMLSHWMACIWGLQTNFSDSKMDTWLAGNAELCQYDANLTVVCLGPAYQYAAAICTRRARHASQEVPLFLSLRPCPCQR